MCVENKKKRWNSFDCMKGLACIAIVFIHYNFPGNLGDAVKAVCRFAVPVFFMTSGFFFLYDGKMDDAKTINKIRHICSIALWAGIFYAFFAIFENVFCNPTWSIKEFIVKKITADRIVKFFITNDPFIYSHLWFLLALLYCYIFSLLLFYKSNRMQVACLFMPILVVFHNILQEFSGLHFFRTSLMIPGTEGRLYLFNLFVFRSLPFFLMGVILKKYSDIIIKISINKKKLVFLFVLGGLIAICEKFTFNEEQFYVGNYIMVIALCIWAIKNPECDNQILRYIGKELSLYIYIFHIAVGKSIDMIMNLFGVKEMMIYQYSRAIIILAVTFIIAMLINNVKKVIMKCKYVMS